MNPNEGTDMSIFPLPSLPFSSLVTYTHKPVYKLSATKRVLVFGLKIALQGETELPCSVYSYVQIDFIYKLSVSYNEHSAINIANMELCVCTCLCVWINVVIT